MAKHTIKLKKYVDIQLSAVAAAAITPGHLIELTSAGKFQKHSTADGSVLPMFALEDELQGNGIDTAYAADDQVSAWIPQRGEEVYAVLKNGETAVIGSKLSSAGDGTLKVFVPQDADSDDSINVIPQAIVGIALEAVDMSGSSGVDPSGRIKVRIY